MSRYDNSSGKRKKTWREIDANRNKSRHVSRHESTAPQKLAHSHAYAQYKKAADALFSHAELPHALAEQCNSQDERQAFRENLQKLLQPKDRASWVKDVLLFVEQYDVLPDDIYVLDSLLDHPKEKIVSRALGHLERLLDNTQPRPKCPPSLLQRLKAIELGSLDETLQAQAKRLRDKWRA